MCRILGYVGPQITLETLLYAPPFSLHHQSFAPRLQDLGRINADGWGVSWYDHSVRELPARYRTATPMWADAGFRDMAALIAAPCVVASVRNASPGAPIEATGCGPFVAGRWSFTHNGYLDGFRDRLGTRLRRTLSEERDSMILGASDSEVYFALVLDQLDRGASERDALRDVITMLRSHTTGRFNAVLSSGQTIVAVRAGNTLYSRQIHDGGAVIASEPLDDLPDWREVPDESIVTVTPDSVTVDEL